MNLEQYLKGRKADKRRLILKAIENITWQIAEVVQIPGSREQYEKMGALTKRPGDPKTVHLRVKATVDKWVSENCTGGVIRMRSPTAWGFELVEEAILFKFTFT